MALVANSTAQLKLNYHHTFELKRNGTTIVRHTLLLNPQNLSQQEQARTNVTQTLGGAFVTDFGSGLIQVNISGTTGYKQRRNADGELRDGWQEFKHFRNEVVRKFIETNDPDYELYWYNWEDEEYYKIQPNTFRLQRSSSEALLYRYEFSFTCLQQATAGTAPAQSTSAALDFINMSVRLATSMSAINEILYKFRGY